MMRSYDDSTLLLLLLVVAFFGGTIHISVVSAEPVVQFVEECPDKIGVRKGNTIKREINSMIRMRSWRC